MPAEKDINSNHIIVLSAAITIASSTTMLFGAIVILACWPRHAQSSGKRCDAHYVPSWEKWFHSSQIRLSLRVGYAEVWHEGLYSTFNYICTDEGLLKD